MNYLEKLKYQNYKPFHNSGILQRLSRHEHVKFQILCIPQSVRTLLALQNSSNMSDLYTRYDSNVVLASENAF